ncbi:unnamed protein product [Phytophthora fragariaefolia]|uniref:Unnamed protein product n=1 Tax=Phytophthora fragariaefolia TaxID=1490495 RepID=A0A9W7CXE4_9STRA|nr:unnamed protein product [Phytophthora fragariaefolia]
MASQDLMSPIRRKAPPLPPRVSSIQPSPNRTEAAAAMMHLLAGSQEPKACPGPKPAKAKRRYVRRAPKKAGTTAKRQIKTAWMDPDADKDAKSGDWRMDGDEVRFFPFREYNRKEKSLGLLCEKYVGSQLEDFSAAADLLTVLCWRRGSQFPQAVPGRHHLRDLPGPGSDGAGRREEADLRHRQHPGEHPPREPQEQEPLQLARAGLAPDVHKRDEGEAAG